MYRVSVSTLEKFRRYMSEASSLDTEEALIESIKGLFAGNDKTQFGGAYHLLIEGEYENLAGRFIVEDFSFSFEQAKPAIDYRNAHPFMVHEMPARKIYESSFFPIQVTGRVDGIEGMHVRDAKTKFRNFTVSEYLSSSQWKFYLDMLGMNTFFYDVFEVIGFDSIPFQPPYCFDVAIVAHPEIKCVRYPDMEKELVILINDFLTYVISRDLLQFLKPALPETSIF